MNILSFFNTAQVYVIEPNDYIKPDSIDLSDYISILSEEEKDRFNRYKNEKAQFTFLTARYYLRGLLNDKIKKCKKESLLVLRHPSGFYGTTSPQVEALGNINQIISNVSYPRYMEAFSNDKNDASSLIIETTPTGKPYLKDYPSLFFNLSHTDNLILIAFSNLPVGVDVEKIERNAEKEAIIKHFFSEKEQLSFFSQTEENRQLAFVKGWTRKEAILKATGDGLSAMKNYEVSFAPDTESPIIGCKSKNCFKIQDFTPKDEYAACIAILDIK